MSSGNVKWFNKTKGYGFIVPDDGSEDVFVHVTVLEKAGMRRLDEGQTVEFETEIKNGRLRAVSVEVTGTSSTYDSTTDTTDTTTSSTSSSSSTSSTSTSDSSETTDTHTSQTDVAA